jgi:hypothetical protein
MSTKKKPAAKKPPVKKVAPKAKKPAAPKKVRRMPPKTPLMLDGKHWDKTKVMAIVCARIASSSKSLMSVLAEPHEGNQLPGLTALMEWIGGDEQIANQYARAKAEQADFMGEEFIELHQKAWVPVMVEGVPLIVDGKPILTVSPASAAAVRLEADNKKWLMGKLRPKKYGERIEQVHSGSIGVAQVLNEIDGQSAGLPTGG